MNNISGIVKSARKIMRQDTGTGSDELRILQLGWMLFLKIFSDKDNIKILDKVQLMTPESIHLNSFMYEPLLDMSGEYLVNLNKEISDKFST